MAWRAGQASEIASTVCPQLPVIKPDICVVNYYALDSRLERHVDLLSKGNRAVPVVAFSLVRCYLVLFTH